MLVFSLFQSILCKWFIYFWGILFVSCLHFHQYHELVSPFVLFLHSSITISLSLPPSISLLIYLRYLSLQYLSPFPMQRDPSAPVAPLVPEEKLKALPDSFDWYILSRLHSFIHSHIIHLHISILSHSLAHTHTHTFTYTHTKHTNTHTLHAHTGEPTVLWPEWRTRLLAVLAGHSPLLVCLRSSSYFSSLSFPFFVSLLLPHPSTLSLSNISLV